MFHLNIYKLSLLSGPKEENSQDESWKEIYENKQAKEHYFTGSLILGMKKFIAWRKSFTEFLP